MKRKLMLVTRLNYVVKKTNGIFVLGVDFFTSDKFRLFN